MRYCNSKFCNSLGALKARLYTPYTCLDQLSEHTIALIIVRVSICK